MATSINDYSTWGPAQGSVVRIGHCRECCDTLNLDRPEEFTLVGDPADRFNGYKCKSC